MECGSAARRPHGRRRAAPRLAVRPDPDPRVLRLLFVQGPGSRCIGIGRRWRAPSLPLNAVDPHAHPFGIKGYVEVFEEAVAAEESGYGQVETEAYLCLYASSLFGVGKDGRAQ